MQALMTAEQIDRENREAFMLLYRSLHDTPAPLAFVGAGISVDAGYPGWNELLLELHKHAFCAPHPTQRASGVLESKDVLWRASVYAKEIGPDFPNVVAQALYPKKPVKKRRGGKSHLGLAEKLANLPFSHYLTTNYDDVLLNALVKNVTFRGGNPVEVDAQSSKDMEHFLATLDKRDRRLVYLHGRLAEPGSLILSEEQYVERYAANQRAFRDLFAIFATRCVMFVGFSLADEDLVYLLRVMRGHHADSPRHFAILPLDEPSRAVTQREYLRSKYGIEPVFFQPRNNNYGDLASMLESLKYPECIPPHKELAIGRAFMEEGGAHLTRVPDNADDPQKGRWGGRSVRSGRRLGATVEMLDDGWYEVSMYVEVHPSNAKPLDGPVQFFVHPTFPKEMYRIHPEQNGKRADLSLVAYGAFTVGALCDQGKTMLELDLSKLKEAPKPFRDS